MLPTTASWCPGRAGSAGAHGARGTPDYEADGAADGATDGATDGAAELELGAADGTAEAGAVEAGEAGGFGATDGATDGTRIGVSLGTAVADGVQAARAATRATDRAAVAIARFITMTSNTESARTCEGPFATQRRSTGAIPHGTRPSVPAGRCLRVEVLQLRDTTQAGGHASFFASIGPCR
jgi:hypothetical protein